MKKISLLLIYLLLVPSIYAQSETHLFVVSGVIVNSQSSKKVDHFVKMVEKKSSYKLKPFYVDSYKRLSKILRENPDALAWTCGAPYVEDSIKDSQQLIAVPLFNKSPTYHSFIVTQKSSSAKDLLDFKGKIFAYSDPRSNSGFVAPSQYLKTHQHDLKDFFRLTMHAGTHERSIEAIYRGLVNVGAIDEYVWVDYINSRPKIAQKLHVIQKMGPFPFTPIVAGKGVSKKVIKKLQKALTTMNKNELTRFYSDFKLDGFVVKEPSFFEPIKKMLFNLNIVTR